jgi:hypothetical protein
VSCAVLFFDAEKALTRLFILPSSAALLGALQMALFMHGKGITSSGEKMRLSLSQSFPKKANLP